MMHFYSEQDKAIRASQCPTCYLCGARGILLYEDLQDRLFMASGTWNFRRCSNSECRFVWLDPMPIQTDLWKIYQTYYTHHKDHVKKKQPLHLRLLRWNIRLIYSLLKRITLLRRERNKINLMYLESVKPGKLLEVGCGNGQRLFKLRKLGWIVVGQEVDPKSASQAQDSHGMEVHVGELANISFRDTFFDAIVMNHVIEHVHSPDKLLSECYRILKPGGILIVTTPNIDSLGHRHFKSHWMALDPLRHLHLFSQGTLQKVAIAGGFINSVVWTTSARTYSTAIGSLDIKRNGKHDMMAQPMLNTEIRAMLFQLLARLTYIYQPDSGDECVLKGVK